MQESNPDRIAIEFPGATAADAAIIAQECACTPQEAGAAAENVRIARSDAEAMAYSTALLLDSTFTS